MKVEVISSSLLKPTQPQPQPNVTIPLTILDRATFNILVPMVYVGRSSMPPVDVMKEGIAKALNYFPQLAGRLTVDDQSRPSILMNDAGIRVVDARVDATLQEILPAHPCPKMSLLHPPLDGAEELFHVQFNRFKCGGWAIGLLIHHEVADGASTSAFLVAWSQLVRGVAVDPLPYHDRAAVAAPRDQLKIEFDHRNIEFRSNNPSPPPTSSVPDSSEPIENLTVHFSVESIKSLKSAVERAQPGSRPSTFECVLADIWKKVTLARKLKGDELTHVRIAVTGRTRITPRVPSSYFGNVVLWAHPTLKAKDLVSGSYASVTKAIRVSVSQIDDRYFKSFLDFGAVVKGQELVGAAPDVADSLSPNVEVDSWLKFQFHEIDFGSGSPLAFIPACLPIEGLMIFMASCSEEGAADVTVALHESTVPYFKEIDNYMKIKKPLISRL